MSHQNAALPFVGLTVTDENELKKLVPPPAGVEVNQVIMVAIWSPRFTKRLLDSFILSKKD